ncbi:ATP-dependent hsl protease ATP-binding subunit hslU (ATP-bindingprotein lapA) [Stutzerimonas stutzeri]|uniref:DUF1654 domain-containing protein n=1 Tax=Stutzerimonas stutzeri subgroup TaxID=578833 RepID=UPI000F717C45|nr:MULTISPECIES: DUF1654 domain-containing protein [Stutzerimonas stutzeri subgroup]MCQ2048796.1 DUF1654 domain-containing protein [Stutzerimonas kunmingensis]QQC13207.1 DUF1654 domain-containing protein [Stutzerimonas stutzeri]VEI35386.1 ATP-dependent hsl protease ATP-binding subunit hslU (ATP-bindingprotein lapA) [Stutzerimonas stutzeri]
MNRIQSRAITHQCQASSYGRLVRRINHLLTAPRAQYERQANLARVPGDRAEDWERLIDEIQQSEGVALTKRPDGSVYVTWRASEL